MIDFQSARLSHHTMITTVPAPIRGQPDLLAHETGLTRQERGPHPSVRVEECVEVALVDLQHELFDDHDPSSHTGPIAIDAA